MYPWPVGNFDYVMDEALDIAMNIYRARTKRLISGSFKPSQPRR
jgi:hypothetical protein